MTQDIKIRVENIFKIFGPNPASVLEQVRTEQVTKASLMERTDHVIGLRDVSLDIPAGQTFVIMGLSGSGKSTLIRHFNRLIEPTAGRILIDGSNILDLNETELRDFRRNKISMVFQRFALLPHKTVLENVIYGLRIRGMDQKEAVAQGMRQIDLVGLDGFAHQYPSQLSGGMQQRVGLARALATDADILLMDEAFSALDPVIRNEMQDQLKDLQARLHKTIVFITHDLDEALRIGDTIAILKDGELRQVGQGSDILLRPADDYVARFVKDVNRGRVVTIGSLATPIAALAWEEADRAGCEALLSDHSGVALCRNGRPMRLLTRETVAGFEFGSDPSGASPIPTLSARLTLEESFKSFSETDGPVLVSDDQGCPTGMVTARTVMKSL